MSLTKNTASPHGVAGLRSNHRLRCLLVDRNPPYCACAGKDACISCGLSTPVPLPPVPLPVPLSFKCQLAVTPLCYLLASLEDASSSAFESFCTSVFIRHPYLIDACNMFAYIAEANSSTSGSFYLFFSLSLHLLGWCLRKRYLGFQCRIHRTSKISLDTTTPPVLPFKYRQILMSPWQ